MRSYHRPVAMWHCPYCGTPQAETARCWVCRRSSTTCSTCRHFRTAITADVGWCGLDRARRPLTGRELRGCWVARPPVVAVEPAPSAGTASPTPPSLRAPGRDTRRFVLLDAPDGHRQVAAAGPADQGDGAPMVSARGLDREPQDAGEFWDARTSLFGDLEP